ncbi:MAG: cadherin domain-containing protein, partial [Hyphomicrobiaceae bacterium]
VTDAGGLTYTETVAIAVNDANEAPTDINVAGGAISENAALGTIVATVAGVDEDAGERFTYALVDDADGRFTIDSETGDIKVVDSLGLDFEAQPTHELTVQVTDSAGNSYVDTVSVALSDIVGERVVGDNRDNVILGDAGNDFLQGGDGADTLAGGEGTDWLYGQNGDDTIFGGDGNDYLIDQSGSDHLQGGNGNDYVIDLDYNGTGRDTLEGGQGDDLLLSGGGGDIVDGGEGNDTLYYSTSTEGVQVTLGGAGETTLGSGGTAEGDQITNVENVLASRFDDSVTGNSENNTIYGYTGDDVIDGGAGDDTLFGDYAYASSHYAGDDTITGGAGDDTIDGGSGNDTAVYSNNWADYTISRETDGSYHVADKTSAEGTDTVSNVESFRFGDVTLNSDELLNTGPTDIDITGGAIDETASSGSVVGTLEAVDDNAADTFTYEIIDDASGAFEIVGNEIRVTADAQLDYEVAQSHEITVQVTDSGGNQYAENVLVSVNDIDEPPVHVMVEGSNGNDNLVGHDGNDIIFGYRGHDRVTGGDGDDIIVGGQGQDTLNGGAGNDTFRVEGQDAYHDNFDGGAGHDVVQGGSGDDVIRVHRLDSDDSIETIDGGEGHNVLAGTSSSDQIDVSGIELNNIDHIDAGRGHDRVTGGDGDDIIVGGQGQDTLNGGAGNDTLDGGTDNDLLYGGDGDDVFLFGEGGGHDAVDGGMGGGWIDSIELSASTPGASIGEYGTDWTLVVDNGEIVSQGSDSISLSQDANGSIELGDGSVVEFHNVESITWG